MIVRSPIACFILVAIMHFSYFSGAQTCDSCTFRVSGIDTASYVLAPGKTLCIDSNGVVKGTIKLTGGTLCNNGLFKPASFTCSSGAVNNNSSITLANNVTLTSAVSWNNNAGSILNLFGSLVISGATLNNNGVLNIDQNLQVTSGVFINLNVVNCNTFVRGGSITNNGIINSN